MVPKTMSRISLLVLLCLVVTALHAATPKVQSWRTSNGAKVVYVHAPDLPMIDVRMVFDAGSARDGAAPGIAAFTNAVLDQGAGPWSADQIAVRLEDRGIKISNGSLRDMAWYSIRSLTEGKALTVALETLSAVLAKPHFAEADVERTRQQMQIALRRALQSPGTVAKRAFFESLYGDHPYAHDPSGNVDSLASISIDDLKAYHKQFYVAANAVISMVGAVDRTRAGEIAEQLSTALPGGEHAPALPKPPAPQAVDMRKDFPSSQTHILVGQAGMSRHDPDYFPLYVGNHILGGGGLVSLLADEVRHARGLSYSVYSYFSPMRAAGPFLMSAQTKNSQADQALDVMLATLNDFIGMGPTAEQLEAAKQNLTGGFPMKIASNSKIVEYISMMGFYDYPLDWLDTMIGKIEAVTAEQIRDAFDRRVNTSAFTAVVVGGEAGATQAAQ